jgi:ribonuclease P protein component
MLGAPKAGLNSAPEGDRAGQGAAVSSQGFPANQRLLRSAMFRAVLGDRCRSGDGLFTVYARENGLTHARIGITVSRKVSLRAVRRNRIKRLVRESFRHRGAIIVGLDVVAIARPHASAATNNDIIQSLEKHWTRVDHRCRKS